MNNCVEIILDGTEEQLSTLFSYSKQTRDSGLTSLEDYIAHTFNQTLVRDKFYGAWALVLSQDNKYVLKMSSPHHNLNLYKYIIPAYLKAGKIALSIYNENIEKIEKAGNNKMKFLLPFGLSMIQTKSVQLLHFPPLETFVYQDYLYSPTNRRWENLLGANNLKPSQFPQLESIVDCVPLAAPGDDSKGIAPFNNAFTPYVKEMLKARLRHLGPATPVVAYGGPVREWLEQSFPKEITGKLKPLSLIHLRLLDHDVTTPVLCANHPSMYLYYTDDNKKADYNIKKEIMTQDLIAAGWQAEMAHSNKDDAQHVLQSIIDYWTDNPRVLDIMDQEDTAYGYNL